jgi:hypothetical protein
MPACMKEDSIALLFVILILFVKARIFKFVILPALLYGCETWSLPVREEYKLGMFENRVLRIFGPKVNGVTGGL